MQTLFTVPDLVTELTEGQPARADAFPARCALDEVAIYGSTRAAADRGTRTGIRRAGAGRDGSTGIQPPATAARPSAAP